MSFLYVALGNHTFFVGFDPRTIEGYKHLRLEEVVFEDLPIGVGMKWGEGQPSGAYGGGPCLGKTGSNKYKVFPSPNDLPPEFSMVQDQRPTVIRSAEGMEFFTELVIPRPT